MKRTPLWVFVAAVGLQIAALSLCIWAMEDFGRLDEDPKGVPEEPPPPLAALNPAPETIAAGVFFRPEPAEFAAAPVFGPPPAARMVVEEAFYAAAEPERASKPARVVAIDSQGLHFVTEPADATSQILHGVSDERMVAFGFYGDGNIRFVDVDGGRYSGKADSARARMRESGGTRAFTVQIGVAGDGRLQATFTGGLHDAETLPLEPMVGWSIA